MQDFRRKYIGSPQFYRNVIAVMLPIMIQTLITNFVNMLDNVMVGRLGNLEMTGVAVSNQLMFVYNLCIFGAISGAGIFGAQFVGKADHEGVKNTLRIKFILCLSITLFTMGLFLTKGDTLVKLYLTNSKPEAAEAALGFARSYIRVILIGLIPYSLAQGLSGTLRETGRTVPPMVAGLTAVTVNLILNYILIFGHFGAPRLGVCGAAAATVISRFVELAIILSWTLKHKHENLFICGFFNHFRIPGSLVSQVVVRGFPLMLNETLWAAGLAFLNQCYSTRGMDVVSATNIVSTFWNVFMVGFTSVGSAIGILVGQELGAGKMEEAVEDDRRLIAFTIFLGAVTGILFACCAAVIPSFYNTTEEVRFLATRIIWICAAISPLDACAHACYFTLRSGGQTYITMIFDSCFVWVIQGSLAFVISRYTAMPILTMYMIVQGTAVLKMCLGLFFVGKKTWVRNIVDAG